MLVSFCQAVLFVYCVIFFISEAVLADPVKIDPVVIDSAVAAGCRDVQDRINIVHFQIVNVLAFCADEMMMPHRIRVEVICPVYRLDLYDLTELGQKRKVPIYGAKADVGILFPKAGIDGICSRMVGSAFQKIFDRFSLSAVFSLHTHRSLIK